MSEEPECDHATWKRSGPLWFSWGPWICLECVACGTQDTVTWAEYFADYEAAD